MTRKQEGGGPGLPWAEASIGGSTEAGIKDVNLEPSAVMDPVKVVLFLIARKKKCWFLKKQCVGFANSTMFAKQGSDNIFKMKKIHVSGKSTCYFSFANCFYWSQNSAYSNYLI